MKKILSIALILVLSLTLLVSAKPTCLQAAP